MEKKRDWFGSCLVALSTVYVLCLFAWSVNVYAGCDVVYCVGQTTVGSTACFLALYSASLDKCLAEGAEGGDTSILNCFRASASPEGDCSDCKCCHAPNAANGSACYCKHVAVP